MSGSRCKELRRRYAALIGSPPSRTVRLGNNQYYVSIWRRLKAAYRTRATVFPVLALIGAFHKSRHPASSSSTSRTTRTDTHI